MAHVIVNDQNFNQEVLQSDKPVLVDFWAEWCGPCRMQGPIIEELGNDKAWEGKAKIAKLEVDENPTTTQQFGVMSIPSLMIFHQGKVVWQTAGVHQKKDLEAALQQFVK